MRRAIFLLAVLLVLQATTCTVFASTGGGDEGGGILDAVGGWFSDLFSSIGKAVTGLLDGLKSLFIPRMDFFPKMQERLRDRLGEKFGGVLSSVVYLQERFSDLRAYRDTVNLFVLRFPASFPLLGGVKIDLLSGASGVVSLIRGALSGFLSLWTAAYAYRKMQALISA